MTPEAAPTFLGLHGPAGVGKDELARAIIDSEGLERLAFADFMRAALYALNPLITKHSRLSDLVDHLGWDSAKRNVPEVRRLMQRFGTEAGRKVLGEDVWVNALFSRAEPGHRYIITDVRFPNEAQRVKDFHGEVWKITRPGVGPLNDHPSEHALDEWSFDEVIPNDSTIESLHERALRTYRQNTSLLLGQ